MQAWLCQTRGGLHPKRENDLNFSLLILMHFIIIQVKYGYQCECGSISPVGRYDPKGGFPYKNLFVNLVNVLMIIWVKYVDK